MHYSTYVLAEKIIRTDTGRVDLILCPNETLNITRNYVFGMVVVVGYWQVITFRQIGDYIYTNI